MGFRARLFDAFPEDFVRCILPLNYSSLPVFAGDQEKVITVLKLEPSDIIHALETGVGPLWWVIVCNVKRCGEGLDCGRIFTVA